MPLFHDKYGNPYECNIPLSSGLDFYCNVCTTLLETRTRLRLGNNVVICPNCGCRTEVTSKLKPVNEQEWKNNVFVVEADRRRLPSDDTKYDLVPADDTPQLLRLRKIFGK